MTFRISGARLIFLDFILEHSFDPSFLSGEATTYGAWLDDLRPRTCLLVYWLSTLGALPAPPPQIQERARRFAWKKTLLSRLIENPTSLHLTEQMIEEDDFDLYVAYLLWMRFVEYVPQRFVSKDSRAQLLMWVRAQIGRPDLTDDETLSELHWHADRIRSRWPVNDNDLPM